MGGFGGWLPLSGGGGAAATELLRQGGSATDWSIEGTTARTVGDWRIELGVRVLGSWGPGDKSVAVTFQTAFAYPPHVLCSVSLAVGTTRVIASASSVTATGFTLMAYSFDGGANPRISWQAIGPV